MTYIITLWAEAMPKPEDTIPAASLTQKLEELDSLLPEPGPHAPQVARPAVTRPARDSHIPVLDTPVTAEDAKEPHPPGAAGTSARGYSPQEVNELLEKMELRFISELDKLITEFKDRIGNNLTGNPRDSKKDQEDNGDS